MPTGRSSFRLAILIAGIVLIAANLRPAITAVGPLVGDIRSSTEISVTAAGLLTTLPLLAFGALSMTAPALARQLRAEWILLISMVVLAFGAMLRGIPGLIPLFAGTALLGGAVAFANVLLPALIKREFHDRLGAMTALYSSVLGGSAALGSGLAIPLSENAGLGWQGAIAIWGALALLAALIWSPQIGRRTRPAEVPDAPPTGGVWRSPLAWQVALFFGLQSLGFYITVAWLPAILIEDGIDEARAGLMLALVQIAGVLSTLIVPRLAEKGTHQRRLVTIMSGMLITGALGLAAAGSSAVTLWVVLLGLGNGAGLALGLMFFVLRAGGPRSAGELSGMGQTVGYLVAATGPFLAGAARDSSGSWTPVLLAMAVLAGLQFCFGMGAGRQLVIDGSQD